MRLTISAPVKPFTVAPVHIEGHITMICTTCNGRRFVIKQERRKWHQDGTWCYMGSLTTGISHVCDDCHGTGLALDPAHDPSCNQCHGTGERGVIDCMDGSYDGTEPCTCSAPVHMNVVEAAFLGRRAM